MPLPQSSVEWPPEPFHRPYEAFERYDAWYSGDVEALGYLYAVNRLQKRTSVWGQVRRFFWGTPTPMTTTQRPVKMHVPVASEICRMAAQSVLSDMPGVRFYDGDHDTDDGQLDEATGKAATERLATLLDDGAHSALLEAAEYRSALGSVFLRVSWDKSINPDGPFITWAAPDSAVPDFRWGRLAAVTFWRELAPLEAKSGLYRLLERHEPGTIEYGLYQAGVKGQLGIRVPLTEHPDTAPLAALVDTQSVIRTGSDLLTAVYVSNGANQTWRKFPVICNLGRSDLASIEDILDSIDEVYTSWMRDIRLGKARIMVPKGLIQPGPAGQGAVFDNDQEIFTELGEQMGSLNPLAHGKGAVDSFIEEYQPNIRWKEHAQTIVHLLSKAYQGAGLSPQSFGDAGEVAVTATEVNSRSKLTSLSRNAALMRWRPALRHLYAALMDVDEFVFDGPGRKGALPDVEFSDADALDPKIVADTVLALVNAEAISLQTRIEQLHPDWDSAQVAAEGDRIREDYSMLPENKANLLWAAMADNGSATGGVDANSYGDKGVNVAADPTVAGPKPITRAPDQGPGTPGR